MASKRATFSSKILPYWLVLPQLAVTLIFFIWPAAQALWQSLLRQDAFGFKTSFVWFANYTALFADPLYVQSVGTTFIFSIAVAALSIGLGLMFAVAVDRLARKGGGYTTLLVWPYAVAPAVAGTLWWFLFNPTIGLVARALQALGYNWNPILYGPDALVLVIVAASWKQIPYCFIFFLAGLQSIPRALIEAAAIDGAGPLKRFWTIIFPLLAPTSFFLLVINLIYALFDTFAVIDATTEGGPAQATNILVYKVFQDGYVGLNLGASAAQSVLLMALVILLTVIQFRFIERRIAY